MIARDDVLHNFDLVLADALGPERVERAVFHADAVTEDKAVDTFGTFGSAGTFGGCFGTVGTMGCCC